MLSQLLQLLFADGGGCARHLVGKMDDRLFFFIKEFAAMVEAESANLLVSDSDPLRRSGMGLGSILAAIDKRSFEVGKFFVFWLYGARAGNG